MRLARWMLCWTLVALAGCTHTAVLDHWQPAPINPVGLKRVTVLDFHGEQGSAVATAITARLWEAEFYTVVDRAQLQGGPNSGDLSVLDNALQRARALGVDALLVGEVIHYRCTDQESQNSHFGLGGVQSVDNRRGRRDNGLGFSFENNHVVTREASVALTYRLVDVRTGEVRASSQASHNFQGQSVNGHPPLPPADAVLAGLLDRCTTDILVKLAPHTLQDDVELVQTFIWSGTRGMVRSGIDSARRGDWPKAEAAFRAAVEANPKSVEAKFNLAVALEAQQRFPEAEALLADVQKQWKDTRVDVALARLRQNQRNFSAVLAQRDALNHDPTAGQLVDGPPSGNGERAILPAQHQAERQAPARNW